MHAFRSTHAHIYADAHFLYFWPTTRSPLPSIFVAQGELHQKNALVRLGARGDGGTSRQNVLTRTKRGIYTVQTQEESLAEDDDQPHVHNIQLFYVGVDCHQSSAQPRHLPSVLKRHHKKRDTSVSIWFSPLTGCSKRRARFYR